MKGKKREEEKRKRKKKKKKKKKEEESSQCMDSMIFGMDITWKVRILWFCMEF